MPYRLGVDVGGTFTDLLMIDEDTGETWRAKTPSTPADPSIGVLAGLDKVCAAAADRARRRSATYARDHGGHQRRAGGQGRPGRPGRHPRATGRSCRWPGRSCPAGWPAGSSGPSRSRWPRSRTPSRRPSGSGARGEVLRPLDEDGVRGRPGRAARRQGSRRSPSSLINSFANPAHERRIAELAAAELPGVPVSLSADDPARDPRVRADPDHGGQLLRPAGRLPLPGATWSGRCATRRSAATLHVLRSDGGLIARRRGRQAPVNLLMCGPAGGVTGALWVAEKAGFENLLTFDMGGTSTDVALVQQRQAADRAGDDGRRPQRPRLLGRRPDRRRRRRLDRPRARADQGAAGRPAERRRRAGPGRLRQGRRPSRPSPTPTSCSATCPPACWAARWAWTRTRPPRPCRRSPTPWAWQTPGGRGRHRRHRQREHVRRAAAGLGPAGLRPARLRPGRLRRGRAAARQRARPPARVVAGHHPAVARGAVRLRRRDHPGPQRVGADLHPPLLRDLRRRRSSGCWPSWPPRRRPTLDGDGVAARRPAVGAVPGRRPLPRPGVRGAGRRRPGTVPRRRAGARRRGVRRRAHPAVHLRPRHRARAGNLRAVVQGRATRVRRRGGPGRRPRPGRRGHRHHHHLGRRTASARPASTTAALLQAGNRVQGPAVVTEMDSTTLILPGHAGEVDR